MYSMYVERMEVLASCSISIGNWNFQRIPSIVVFPHFPFSKFPDRVTQTAAALRADTFGLRPIVGIFRDAAWAWG
jgi:hypothetical protein